MKNNKWIWILTIIPWILTGVALFFLPNEVPLHSDLAGNIDRWGSKYEMLFWPICILFVSLMWQCFVIYFNKKAKKATHEKEQVEAMENVKILRLVACGSALLFTIMNVVSLYSAYVESEKHATVRVVDTNCVFNVVLGIMLIILGNYLPKVRRNGVIGLRTKATMKDDGLWKKTNRFAGISMMVAGGLILLETVILQGMISTAVMVGILLLMAIVDCVYAYKEMREIKV